MKVSIVTVVYNAESTIESCIKNVVSQTYKDIEYIIIDGKSTDKTLDIISNHKDNISKLISERDNGIYDAMNKGINNATGDIVGFINSDDYFASDDVVASIVEVFKNNDVDCCYGDVIYFDEYDNNKLKRYWKTKKNNKNLFNDGTFPPHPSFYVKRECYERYGLYKVDFKIASDFELMLRFIKKNGIKTFYLPKTFVKMRSGGAANKNFKNVVKGLNESKESFVINGLPTPFLFRLKTVIFRFMQQFVR